MVNNIRVNIIKERGRSPKERKDMQLEDGKKKVDQNIYISYRFAPSLHNSIMKTAAFYSAKGHFPTFYWAQR